MRLSDLHLMFAVPQKITLEDLNESKSALEEKSADRSHSVNSMRAATHETTNVAVYEVSYIHGVTAPALHTCETQKSTEKCDLSTLTTLCRSSRATGCG